jgi:hypothetical protein
MVRNKQPKPEPEKNKIYQIVIGVNEYEELNSLRYAASTARFIAELIKNNTENYLENYLKTTGKFRKRSGGVKKKKNNLLPSSPKIRQLSKSPLHQNKY